MGQPGAVHGGPSLHRAIAPLGWLCAWQLPPQQGELLLWLPAGWGSLERAVQETQRASQATARGRAVIIIGHGPQVPNPGTIHICQPVCSAWPASFPFKGTWRFRQYGSSATFPILAPVVYPYLFVQYLVEAGSSPLDSNKDIDYSLQ